MKIGIIFGQVYHGAVRAMNEADALFEDPSIEVFMLCFNDKDETEIIRKERFTMVKLAYKSYLIKKYFAINNTIPLHDFMWKKYIVDFVQTYECEFLIAHDIFMLAPTFKALKSLELSLPVIVNLHENYPEVVQTYTWANKTPHKWIARPGTWLKKEAKLLKQVQGVILLSEDYKGLLKNKYSFLENTPFFILPNIPNIDTYALPEELDQNLGITNDDFIIQYFGNIGRRRGIFTTIKALKEVIKRYPEIKLMLIGPVDNADKQEFYSAIDEESVRANIIYIPWIEASKFLSYAALADVGICPIIKNAQHESGIANKIYQYMWSATPQLVSNCKPQMELIEKEKCGVVFKSEDVADLRDKMISIFENKHMLKQMGENGKRAIESTYQLKYYSKGLSEFVNLISAS